ncbi:MAG: DUF805 domain-containing protein [Alphaproteobacteria bacterium]|nr:DUF805 domain-containing protein [Alphaproteobacteria bacterium]
MNFIQAVTSVFKNSFNFKDRAMRSEYWYFMLFSMGAGFVAGLFDAASFPEMLAEYGTGPVGIIEGLALLVPSISVTIRRLHDVNKSGWWQLIALTIIGIIPLFYWMIKKGDAGENRFGEDPMSFTQV